MYFEDKALGLASELAVGTEGKMTPGILIQASGQSAALDRPGEAHAGEGGQNQEFCLDKLSWRNFLVIHLEMSGWQLELQVWNTRSTQEHPEETISGTRSSVLQDVVTLGWEPAPLLGPGFLICEVVGLVSL